MNNHYRVTGVYKLQLNYRDCFFASFHGHQRCRIHFKIKISGMSLAVVQQFSAQIPLQGVRIQSLVRELKFHMPQCMAKNKKLP